MYLPCSSSLRGVAACADVSARPSARRSGHRGGPRTKRDELSLRVVLALPNAGAPFARPCPRTRSYRAPSQRVLPAGRRRRGSRAGRTLQDRVRVEQLVLDVVDVLAGAGYRRDVPHDDLGRLGLAGAGLAGNEDALVNVAVAHVAVRVVRHRKATGSDAARASGTAGAARGERRPACVRTQGAGRGQTYRCGGSSYMLPARYCSISSLL